MILLLIIVFNITSLILAERGDLISFEFKEMRTSESVQYDLDNSSVSQLGPNAIYDIKLYSIVYETINQFGDYAEASGSIAIPYSIDSMFPFYLFGHGTQVRRGSAPSMNGFNDLNMWVATSGYIYLEPDYLGLGISGGLHPYHLKDVTAATMIDMIYASKQFCREVYEPVNYNNQLFIAGYSEGGYAAMATVKEIEENYSDIDITMSFPMAGAYDLSGTMVDLMLSQEVYADPFYLPFFILSYIEKYELGTIADFFKVEYAEILPELFSGEYSGGYINSFLPDIPINMISQSVVEDFDQNPNFEFKLRLEENNLTNWYPENTMYLFHGLADERVPYANSVVAYESLGGSDNPNLYFESLPESYGGHQDAAPWCLITAFNISESVKQISQKGDLNNDSLRNIFDIIILIEHILLDNIDNSFNFWIYNIFDYDNDINILDLVILIDKIYNDA